MLEKIISGGQTGADQSGWRVARTMGIATGGWMPKGFLTADGAHPEFAEQYGAAEMPTDDWALRTERNVRDSDGTLWFGETTSAGAADTVGACRRLGKPCMLIYPGAAFEPAHVVAWLRENQIRTLNVAGNREEVEPGIGTRVERFLRKTLEQLSDHSS